MSKSAWCVFGNHKVRKDKMQTHSNIETTNSGISIIVDKTSRMGQFAWVTFLENVHVPVIFRNNVEYVSLLALRCQLPANHVQINKAIEKAQVSEMTKNEVKLYNELNNCHCDGLLCELHKFTKKDLLVRLDEFDEVFPLRRPKPLEIETEQPSESAARPISKVRHPLVCKIIAKVWKYNFICSHYGETSIETF